MMIPAARNRRALKNACVIKWKMAVAHANSQRQEHITDLAHTGICEYASDVVLRQRAETCH